MLQSISSATARAADLARGTLSALWPRGAVSHEMSRLREEGYTSGERCDIAFSVGFDDAATAAEAAQALRVARYAVDATQVARGFVTVQESLPLRALDLAVATARLERIVARWAGFVALVGPTQPAPSAAITADEVTSGRRGDPTPRPGQRAA